MNVTGELLPNQADMIECEALFCAGYGGQGSGKTHAAQIKMFSRLRRYPAANHYVCGADFEQLRPGYFLDMRIFLSEVLRWREGEDFRYVDSPRPMVTLLDTGATVRSLSAELADRMRSLQIQSLHAEEPQTWNKGEQIWQTLIGRMRHSVRSSRLYPSMPICAWLTFNPGGNPGAPTGSWLHTMIEEKWPRVTGNLCRCPACRSAAGYPSWRFSLRDNYLLRNGEQYIRNLEMALPPHLWPVEIDGHWPTMGGDVYRGFDASIHGMPHDGLPPMALDPSRPLMLCCDFNVGHMAWVVAQAHDQQKHIVRWEPPFIGAPPAPIVKPLVAGWQERLIVCLDEIAIENATVSDALAEFVFRYGNWVRDNGVTVRLYGDSTGGNRNQQTITSNWEVIMHGLTAAGIGWEAYIPANGPEWDRVNAMNSQFRTGAGYGMLVDLNRCPRLINDWRNVPRKENENRIDKLKDPAITHWSDALGYAVLTEQRIWRREEINFLDFVNR